MSIRTQIARDFKGDERNEDYEHQCGEGNRSEARSDEGERYKQAYDAQAHGEYRPEDTSRSRVLNKACTA